MHSKNGSNLELILSNLNDQREREQFVVPIWCRDTQVASTSYPNKVGFALDTVEIFITTVHHRAYVPDTSSDVAA